MANSWLRLWHDMPNDPKWRTIARASKQSIPAVMAVYLHLIVNASNATERGRTQNVCSEDIASALDLECEQVDEIIAAMQGRVLDGDQVTGWAKRQVEREDGSAERAKAWREAQKLAKQTQPNATERKQTPDTDTDTDTDKEETESKAIAPKPQKKSFSPESMQAVCEGLTTEIATEYFQFRKLKHAPLTPSSWKLIAAELVQAGMTPDAALAEAMAAGWQGFKASWLANRNQPRSGAPPQSIHEKRANTIAELTGANKHEQHNERDITGESIRVAG